jgi:hypothetical protein
LQKIHDLYLVVIGQMFFASARRLLAPQMALRFAMARAEPGLLCDYLSSQETQHVYTAAGDVLMGTARW